MRKDNRKVLSPSGQARGSTSNNKANLSLDSRVKPENDSVWVVVKPEGDNKERVPENDVIKRVHENDNTFVKGGCGWKRRGGVTVLAMSLVFCLCAGEVLAQCAVPPSCESLGYDKTAEDCIGINKLKCPFDQNKIFCNTTACSDTHKLDSCPARSSCTFCDNNSKYQFSGCNLGYNSINGPGCNEKCVTCSLPMGSGYKFAQLNYWGAFCGSRYIEISYTIFCKNFSGQIMNGNESFKIYFNSEAECLETHKNTAYLRELIKKQIYKRNGTCSLDDIKWPDGVG